MKITRRIVEHYNTGPFEWVEISAKVEAEVEGEEDYDDLDAALDDALAVARVRIESLTKNNDSMIHVHPALQGAP